MRARHVAAVLIAGALSLGAMGGSRSRSRSGEPDSLTFAYDVSGLRVIQHVNRNNDLVAVSLYLLGGTRQLTPRTEGIEALLLHASGYGTASFPGAKAERAMARTGSIVMLEPDADWTAFGFVGLRQTLDSAWSVFADRLMHPTLTPEAVGHARDGMLATARRRFSDPDERIRVIANQAAFADHPYALDPEGTVASLTGLTVADLSHYARTQMVTSRLLLVVVGNVERSRVESLVTATIGRLPPGDYRWTLPPPVPRRTMSHWLIESRALPTNYILGYFPGPPVSGRDYAAFRVATDMLSSRLFETIRVEHSLSYAAFAPFLDRAVAVGGIYASTPAPERVLPMMRDQIRVLLDRPIDPFTLHRYVSHYLLDYLAHSGSDADLADFLARAQLYRGDFRLTGEYMSQLRHLAPEDIYHAVDHYMRVVQWAYLGDTVRMKGAW
jgi:zinc protease